MWAALFKGTHNREGLIDLSRDFRFHPKHRADACAEARAMPDTVARGYFCNGRVPTPKRQTIGAGIWRVIALQNGQRERAGR